MTHDPKIAPDAGNFRLAVLNPGGRDHEQHFAENRAPQANEHPPVNFHAYAACTHGAVFRDTKRAIASNWPVLLLLRGDFRASERALAELKKSKRKTVVALGVTLKVSFPSFPLTVMFAGPEPAALAVKVSLKGPPKTSRAITCAV